VPAVVFGPDQVIGRGRPRTALVLGAGGVLGAAWMTGALVRLHERLPTADVDLLVGTSAGSVLAAALRCRASLDEIVAWQAGDVTGTLSESMVLAEQDGPLPPWPQPRPGSLPLARAALFLQVPPWVGASGWLPHGRGRHVAVRSLIGALQKRHPEDAGSWADGRTWIAAMDYDTGQRVLFGRPGAPPARPSEAVVSIIMLPDHVSLCFIQDAPNLPDPQRLLKGSGNVVRHIRLSSARDLDSPAIRALIKAAIRQSDVPFVRGARGRLVIRSISKKQRPRRPV